MSTVMLGRLNDGLQSEVLAKAFWALGHPMRMRIVGILMQDGERTVGDLADRLPVSQPQVSVHLKCLTGCGFLSVRREGRRAYYQVASPWVAGLLSLMRDHADTYCAELLACVGCAPSELPHDVDPALVTAATGTDVGRVDVSAGRFGGSD